jgi:predicted DNA-binding transcriptional regulator AlpA
MSEKLTIDQIAELLQVSRRTADSFTFRPDFPKPIRYTPRGKRFFEREKVLAWQEKQRY